jgi:hypothetical protein
MTHILSLILLTHILSLFGTQGSWARVIPPPAHIDPPAILQRMIHVGTLDPVLNTHSTWELHVMPTCQMAEVVNFLRHLQELAPKLAPPKVPVPDHLMNGSNAQSAYTISMGHDA